MTGTSKTGPIWLEVALNGPWGRDTQHGIPVTPEEIIAEGVACAREGAAIIHLHAYDVETGRQRDDADVYSQLIEGIRSQVDVIVYPTLPFVGSIDQRQVPTAAERFRATEILGRRGLLEWAVVDPGSTNLSLFSQVAEDREGFVYANPESHLRYGLDLAQRYGFVPSYAIYEPGFLRLGAACTKRYPGAPCPVYRFMFSDQFSFGFPPQDYALDAYLKLLNDCAPGAPWMVAGLGVNIERLVEGAIGRGGHVRVGLEDAPLGTDQTNLSLTKSARHIIERSGYALATAEAVRKTWPKPTS
jgi:3-keto-5-aminohexanoate cleavage enzyme